MSPKQSINKYHNEYKRKLDIEQHKFDGKICAGEVTETASEMTSATKLTGKKSSIREGETDGIETNRDAQFEPNPMDRLDEEDELEEERLN